MTFDLGVKVTRNVVQYPLHHVTYSPTKFGVASSNGLGGDTFTRNVTDARTARRTDGRRTDFDTKINTCIPFFFSKEKSGYNNEPCTVCIRFITVLFAPLRQYYKIPHVSNSNLPFWSVVSSFLKVLLYM